VLGFNPLKLANAPLTARNRVVVKSLEKTTRMFLIHLVKRCAWMCIVPEYAVLF
jgi:symplekin